MSKLDKIITIGTTDYEVQATTAEKVEQSLTINKHGFNNESGEEELTEVSFDGQEAKIVDVVPATGGAFEGPIRVPNLDGSTPNDKQVLNYQDISSIITTKTGAGWYTWQNATLSPVTKGKINQHLGIVVGTSEDLLNSEDGFNVQNQNKNNKFLPYYLYICNETTGPKAGNLYYGTSEADCIQIVNNAKTLTGTVEITDDEGNKEYPEKAFNAQDIQNILQRLAELNKVTTTLSSDITSQSETITKNYAKADSDLKTAIEKSISDIITRLNNICVSVNGAPSFVVKKANSANKAANSELLDGNDSTYFQKKIFVQKALPTSGVSEGDICIIWE